MSRPCLGDIHGALSHLAFAVQQNLEPLQVGVSVEWHPISFLSVAVECYGKDVQMVTDRLSHGVLQGEYDYRFSVSRPLGVPEHDWTTVRAYPSLAHDKGSTQ